MGPPIGDSHPYKVFGSIVDIVVPGVDGGQFPAGVRSEGKVGNMAVGQGVISGDDGAALAVFSQPEHGSHAGGFKEKIWFKTRLFKKLVNDNTHGGGFFDQGEQFVFKKRQGYLRILVRFCFLLVSQGVGFGDTQVKGLIENSFVHQMLILSLENGLEADIHFLGIHHFNLCIHICFNGLENSFRILGMDDGINSCKHLYPSLWCQPNGDGASPFFCHILDLVVGLLFYLEDLLGAFHVEFPDLSKLPVIPCADKQGSAQFCLQFQQLLVQGGLGQI